MKKRQRHRSQFSPPLFEDFEVHEIKPFTKDGIKTLPPEFQSVEGQRAYAASLRAEIISLGGTCGDDRELIQNQPDHMIQFYERVLQTEYEMNGRKPEGPN